MKNKTSPEYSKLLYLFSHFAVIWIAIFHDQKQYFTGFQLVRNFVKKVQICMAYFHIKMIGWQELEPSVIKDQICQKIITQAELETNLNIKAPIS